MTRLILKRVASGIIVLWVLSVAVFTLFFIAPNDGIEFASPRQVSEIAAVFRERLVVLLGILISNARTAPRLLDRFQ